MKKYGTINKNDILMRIKLTEYYNDKTIKLGGEK